VTGLDYAINRHYDSLQGRFTQVDPIGAGATDISDPQSWNMYAYCGNDPINHTDPDGLFFGKLFKWIGKALKWIAIAAAVATAVLTVFAGPLAGTVLGQLLGFIAGIPNAIGSFIGGVGKTIAGIFSFAESGGVSAQLATRIGYGVLLGGSAAVGAIANHLQEKGKRVSLSGRLLTVYQAARDRLLKLLRNPKSRCAQFLKRKGIDPNKVADDLQVQVPYAWNTVHN